MNSRLIYITILILILGSSLLAGRFPQAELSISKSDLIFAHSNHTDMECSDCHSEIINSKSAHDRNFPEMDVCGDCHDIEDSDQCGLCHLDPDDIQERQLTEQTINFNHQSHLQLSINCDNCHGEIASSSKSSVEFMPSMATCLNCHDNTRADASCSLCHGSNVALTDIHPDEWTHQHGDMAGTDQAWCRQCHQKNNTCLDCHRGDNVTGSIHDLNYLYNHGLDAQSKRLDCARCHDRQMFCNNCHERENLLPLLHSSVAWRTDHGRVARRDIENCASCHDSADPTCARSGCHRDDDGLRGTDPRFHSAVNSILDSRGPWHDDDGYYCYRCHTNTRTIEEGFCGYCHGS